MGAQLAPRKGGSFSTDRVEALLALLKIRASKGGGFGAAASFLFRPGGTAGGNVFTAWAPLAAAIAATPGPKDVGVDSSLAQANVTPGTFAVDECTFYGFNFFSELHFETGAFFTAGFLSLVSITFTNDGATSPYSPTATSELLTYDSVIQSSAGAAPWMHVTTTTVVSGLVVDGFSFIGDGTHAAITIDAGHTFTATVLGASVISGNTIVGAGNLGIEVSPSGTIGPQPGVTGALTVITAGQNLVVATNTAPIGPAATVSLASSAIVRERGGRTQVSGSISVTGVAVGGGTITVNLLRDATIILSATLDPGAGGRAADTLTTIDALPDFVAHTYTIEAIASVGTLTIAALQASINASEV